jgi:type I restriction enzyme S subunit
MSKALTVRLDEVVAPVERSEIPQAGKTYRQIGVKLWGEGAYERETIDGSLTKYAKLFRAREGDFVVNKIWARNGSVAVVPESLAGCFGSGEFPMFAPKRDRLEPRWLHWLTKTAGFWAQCDQKSQGTSGKNRIKPSQILSLEIPLPLLSEQRRMVAKIDELAAHIYEARTLRLEAEKEADALLGSYLGVIFNDLAKTHPTHALGDLSSHILDGPHITPSYLPEGVPGIPFVTVKNMVSGQLDFSDLNYVSNEDHQIFSRRCQAQRGDVLYSKDGATRGRPCYVDTDREFSYFVSVALIKPLRERLDGRYLVHLLSSNWIKDRMAEKSRGDMIPHIVLREIRAFPIPTPSLVEQRRIVSELDALQAKVGAVKNLQAETAVELDALLPAFLDRVFNGDSK